SEEIAAMRASAATPKSANRIRRLLARPCRNKPRSSGSSSSGFYPKPSGLLNPELIHARKRIRVFGFKGVPTIEVRPRPPRRLEMTSVLLKHRKAEFKADKFESVL